jgi:hypothetical protein
LHVQFVPVCLGDQPYSRGLLAPLAINKSWRTDARRAACLLISVPSSHVFQRCHLDRGTLKHIIVFLFVLQNQSKLMALSPHHQQCTVCARQLRESPKTSQKIFLLNSACETLSRVLQVSRQDKCCACSTVSHIGPSWLWWGVRNLRQPIAKLI